MTNFLGLGPALVVNMMTSGPAQLHMFQFPPLAEEITVSFQVLGCMVTTELDMKALEACQTCHHCPSTSSCLHCHCILVTSGRQAVRIYCYAWPLSLALLLATWGSWAGVMTMAIVGHVLPQGVLGYQDTWYVLGGILSSATGMLGIHGESSHAGSPLSAELCVPG